MRGTACTSFREQGVEVEVSGERAGGRPARAGGGDGAVRCRHVDESAGHHGDHVLVHFLEYEFRAVVTGVAAAVGDRQQWYGGLSGAQMNHCIGHSLQVVEANEQWETTGSNRA